MLRGGAGTGKVGDVTSVAIPLLVPMREKGIRDGDRFINMCEVKIPFKRKQQPQPSFIFVLQDP